MNRIIFFLCLASSLCASMGYSTESTLIEEQLYKEYLTGNIENARTQYLGILNKRLDLLNENLSKIAHQPTEMKTKTKRVIWHAGLIQSAKRALSWFEFFETTVRLKGGITPEAILVRIFNAAIEIEVSARAGEIGTILEDIEAIEEFLEKMDVEFGE